MVDERADRYPYARLADGLRADSALSYNAFPAYHNSTEPVAPYLRSIVRERGAFGVSHTHVPTESRPGHVALIGALYSIGHRRARLTRSFRWDVRGCLGCHQGYSFSRPSFKDGTDDRPRGGKRILWTSTRCSTSQAPPSHSGPLISSRYLPTAPSPVGSTHGPTTRTTKTLRKVLVSQSLTNHARGHLLTFFKTCRGIYTRHLGLRTFGNAFPKRDLGSFIGCAIAPRKDSFLLASFGFGRHRSLTPAAFTGEGFPLSPYLAPGTHTVSRLVRSIWKTSKSWMIS